MSANRHKHKPTRSFTNLVFLLVVINHAPISYAYDVCVAGIQGTSESPDLKWDESTVDLLYKAQLVCRERAHPHLLTWANGVDNIAKKLPCLDNPAKTYHAIITRDEELCNLSAEVLKHKQATRLLQGGKGHCPTFCFGLLLCQTSALGACNSCNIKPLGKRLLLWPIHVFSAIRFMSPIDAAMLQFNFFVGKLIKSAACQHAGHH